MISRTSERKMERLNPRLKEAESPITNRKKKKKNMTFAQAYNKNGY